MKFKVDLPIVNLSAVVFQIEAESEDDAVQQAHVLWDKYADKIIHEFLAGDYARNDGDGRLELELGVMAIEYNDFAGSWIGDDIHVDPVKEQIIEPAE
jgi:hypothetical protein